MGLTTKISSDSTKRADSADIKREETPFEALAGICSVLVVGLFILTFLAQNMVIPSGSMENTLLVGDHVVVDQITLAPPSSWMPLVRYREPRRGDIVVFQFPSTDPKEFQCGGSQYGKDFIKRVVGMPGDKVQVKEGMVYINDVRMPDEPYTQYLDGPARYPAASGKISPGDYQTFWQNRLLGKMYAEYIRDNFGPVVVPPGSYMVMGDNRDRSCDSRYWGPVPESNIKGRAWFTYWPLNRMGFPH